MRRFLRPLGWSLVLSIGGCMVFSGPDEPQPVRDLVAARARWNISGPSSYTVVARTLCFCIHGGQDVRVVVQRGSVVSATLIDTGQPIDAAYRSAYKTIEQLFDLIEEAARQPAHRIDVTYDPQLGYPVHFFIDYSERMADEEFGYEIRSFTSN